jgi:predicted NBD/HSP70 family sugar kinase
MNSTEPEAVDAGNPNRTACIRVLRDLGPLSVSAIAKSISLSRPTVEGILADLQEAGLVVPQERDTDDARGAGRPAKVFSFNAGASYVVAVDIGPRHVRGLIADMGGNVWASVTQKVTGATGIEYAGLVSALVQELMFKASVPAREVGVAVVAVPGVVDRQGRVLVSAPIPDWTGIDLAHQLSSRLKCRVLLENDVNLAVLAEHRVGAAQLAEDIVFIMPRHREASARLNAGLIINGDLHRGRHSIAGEIAELRSGTGRAQAETEAEGSMPDVDVIAANIAMITLAVDPDIVVLGGGLAHSEPVFREALQQAIAASTPFPILPTILPSQLGSEVVVTGALVRALESGSAMLLGSPGLGIPRITRRDLSGQAHQPAGHQNSGHQPATP